MRLFIIALLFAISYAQTEVMIKFALMTTVFGAAGPSLGQISDMLEDANGRPICNPSKKCDKVYEYVDYKFSSGMLCGGHPGCAQGEGECLAASGQCIKSGPFDCYCARRAAPTKTLEQISSEINAQIAQGQQNAQPRPGNGGPDSGTDDRTRSAVSATFISTESWTRVLHIIPFFLIFAILWYFNKSQVDSGNFYSSIPTTV